MIYRFGGRTLFLPVIFAVLLSYSLYAADVTHVVTKGETVYSISRLYNISQEDLMRKNNIADASKLQLGMKLIIVQDSSVTPAAAPPAANSTAYIDYLVSPNDTLYSIARVRGVTLQALRDSNGFSKNYVLKAGEKIKIPIPSLGTVISPQPPKKDPVFVSSKTASPSLRWPVTAKEVLYMSSEMAVLVSGTEFESIKSLTRGTVVHASPFRGYGNVAVIETDDGYRYMYGTCQTLSVRKGDIIEPGTELGKLGIYPPSGKPDLVFMVLQNGSPIDPAKAPRS